MNKFYALSISSFVMFVFLFPGCKEFAGSGQGKDLHLANTDSLINQYNAFRPEWDRAIRTEGDVNIVIKDNMIFIEYAPDSSDQREIYFMPTEVKESLLKAGHFGRAEVLFLERSLIVNSLEKDLTLYFSMRVDPEPAFLEKWENVKKYKGIGMGLRKINKVAGSEIAPACGCLKSGNKENICNLVLSGDISCSAANSDGSCRIVCSGQWIACCDMKQE